MSSMLSAPLLSRALLTFSSPQQFFAMLVHVACRIPISLIKIPPYYLGPHSLSSAKWGGTLELVAMMTINDLNCRTWFEKSIYRRCPILRHSFFQYFVVSNHKFVTGIIDNLPSSSSGLSFGFSISSILESGLAVFSPSLLISNLESSSNLTIGLTPNFFRPFRIFLECVLDFG